MVTLIIIYLNIKQPEELCNNQSFMETIKKYFLHFSPSHLLWTLYALYQLFELENKIGMIAMGILTIWLMWFTNKLQQETKTYIKPVVEFSEKHQFVDELHYLREEYIGTSEISKNIEKNIDKTVDIIKPTSPCALGFTSIILALDIVSIYIQTRGGLVASWGDIQWMLIQFLPALFFTYTTLHSELSGLAAGVLTVVGLDLLKLIG
jgi:hypothetical protein